MTEILPTEASAPPSDLQNALPDRDAGHRNTEVKKEYARLINKGMNLLAMREHSMLELTNKLLSKTVTVANAESADLVYAVIDELVERKLLSDIRFTESYVRWRRNRGQGPVKIRHELKQKGINDSLIEQNISLGSTIWLECAHNEYHKKYRGQPISDYNTWTKRARFLQSRGFTTEQIQSTLDEINEL